MDSTVINEIIAFVLGRKYYANIINTRGTDKCEICSFIFKSKQEAAKHRLEIQNTMSFSFVETISFRSRREF